jgi:hypothetical protein
MKNTNNNPGGKSEGSGTFGIPTLRQEDYIQIYLREIGCGSMGWIY